MDGSNRIDLVREDLRFVNGIAFDRQSNLLYWANGGKEEIGMLDLKANKRYQICGKAVHPFAISVLDNNLYWTDWARKVTRFDMTTKQHYTV